MTQVYKVTQYRVRHGKHVATVASLKTAANKAAWWMIFDKYSSDDPELRSNAPWHPRVECNCQKVQDDWVADWFPCPLHNRQDGYFRRLHTRLSRQLLAQFKDQVQP